MMYHNSQSHAYVAGKMLPRAWHGKGVHQEWWQARRWKSTSAINQQEKRGHTRKTRQWFARELARELAMLTERESE